MSLKRMFPWWFVVLMFMLAVGGATFLIFTYLLNQ